MIIEIINEPISDLEKIDKLQGLPQSTKFSDTDGASVLHWATYNSGIQLFEWLWQKLIAENVTLKLEQVVSSAGTNILFYAAKHGNLVLFQYIYERCPHLLHATNNNKQTIAHFAAMSKTLTILKKIAAINALKLSELINISDEFGGYPIHYAAEYNNADCLQYLLQYGASYEQPLNNDYGSTPLHIACEYNSLETVKLLHKLGADVNKANKKGGYPIHSAAERNQVHITQYLLDQGVSCEQPTNNNLGHSPLHFACTYGSLETVKLLLVRGANVNKVSEQGWYPIHLAVEKNHADVIKCLLDYGASCEQKQQSKYFADETPYSLPVHVACGLGNLNALIVLSNYGANLQRQAENGNTALHITARAKGDYGAIISYLLTKGADVGKCNNEGELPLHLAARVGNVNCFRALYEQSIAPLYRQLYSSSQHNFLTIAIESLQVEIVKVIIELERSNAAPEIARNLLKNKPSIFEDTIKDGNTILHVIAQKGMSTTYRAQENHTLKTPFSERKKLLNISFNKLKKITQLILPQINNNSLDITAQNNNDQTVLEHMLSRWLSLDAVAKCGRKVFIQIMEMLIDSNCHINFDKSVGDNLIAKKLFVTTYCDYRNLPQDICYEVMRLFLKKGINIARFLEGALKDEYSTNIETKFNIMKTFISLSPEAYVKLHAEFSQILKDNPKYKVDPLLLEMGCAVGNKIKYINKIDSIQTVILAIGGKLSNKDKDKIKAISYTNYQLSSPKDIQYTQDQYIRYLHISSAFLRYAKHLTGEILFGLFTLFSEVVSHFAHEQNKKPNLNKEDYKAKAEIFKLIVDLYRDLNNNAPSITANIKLCAAYIKQDEPLMKQFFSDWFRKQFDGFLSLNDIVSIMVIHPYCLHDEYYVTVLHELFKNAEKDYSKVTAKEMEKLRQVLDSTLPYIKIAKTKNMLIQIYYRLKNQAPTLFDMCQNSMMWSPIRDFAVANKADAENVCSTLQQASARLSQESQYKLRFFTITHNEDPSDIITMNDYLDTHKADSGKTDAMEIATSKTLGKRKATEDISPRF